MLCNKLYTIVDLVCENGFPRTVPHRKWSPRWEMQWEVYFKQNI